MTDSLLTLTEAAERIGRSAVWLRKQCAAGRAPCVAVGVRPASYLIREEDLPRIAVLKRERGRPRKEKQPEE